MVIFLLSFVWINVLILFHSLNFIGLIYYVNESTLSYVQIYRLSQSLPSYTMISFHIWEATVGEIMQKRLKQLLQSIDLRSWIWHVKIYHKPKIQRDSSWASVLIPNVTVTIAHATHVNVLLNINALVHLHQRIENFWSQNGIGKVIGIQIRNNKII